MILRAFKLNRFNMLGIFIACLLLSTGTLASHHEGEVKGDIEAGKTKSATCAACHGADGNSAVPNFPKLAGQGEKYTIKQLKDMKSNVRPVPEMVAFLQNMTEQDMADYAAYYNSQAPTVGAADPDLVELGEALYRMGDPESSLPSCLGCHGAKGDGLPGAGFPMLSGQHAAYTEQQLKAFRAAGRGDEGAKYRNNDYAKMMRSVAALLTDEQIKALASYLSGLH